MPPPGLASQFTTSSAAPVLRTRNNSAQQQFYAFGDTQNDQNNANDGIQWLNVGSGRVVTPSVNAGRP
jgi:hypothetical protein